MPIQESPGKEPITLERLKAMRAERPDLPMNIVDFAIEQAERVEELEEKLSELEQYHYHVRSDMEPNNEEKRVDLSVNILRQRDLMPFFGRKYVTVEMIKQTNDFDIIKRMREEMLVDALLMVVRDDQKKV